MTKIQRLTLSFLLLNFSLLVSMSENFHFEQSEMNSNFDSTKKTCDNSCHKSNFYEYRTTVSEMEHVFDSSPYGAQSIVEYLKNLKQNKNHSYRCAMFVGPTGTGKTIMAYAIAYKMQQEGWVPCVINIFDMLAIDPHETNARLQTTLNTIALTKKPVIVIIDDLNVLLKNIGNRETKKVFWDFLESNKNNPNFFLVATMSKEVNLPERLKNLNVSQRIQFFGFPANVNKIEALRAKLEDQNFHLAKDINDEFLNQQLENFGNSGRDFEQLTTLIFKIYLRTSNENDEHILITKQHIEQAVKEYAENEKAMKF